MLLRTLLLRAAFLDRDRNERRESLSATESAETVEASAICGWGILVVGGAETERAARREERRRFEREFATAECPSAASRLASGHRIKKEVRAAAKR